MAFLFSNHGLSWSVNEMVPVKLLLVPNNAPTVDNEVPDQTAVAGTSFSYQVPADAFSDPDSDTLAYAATKADDTMLPTRLGFDAATRTFTGTPAAGDVGMVSVKVTATDTSSATVSDEFDIVVIPAAPAGFTPRRATGGSGCPGQNRDRVSSTSTAMRQAPRCRRTRPGRPLASPISPQS